MSRVTRPLVVVPTYNERASLPDVVAGARGAKLEVLVVDDASPDGTGTCAERLAEHDAGVHVLHRAAKAGLGSAYREGFAWALAAGYDAVGEMDADGSHDPADLPRLRWALERSDLVIGSRYVPAGGVVDWPPARVALSEAGNRYVKWATGIPVEDATAGFRLYRAAALASLEPNTLRSDGYAFQVELALRAWRSGFRVVEVPITFTERRHGASKLSRRIVVEAVTRVAGWGLRGPRGPMPAHPHSVARGSAHARGG